MDPGRMANLQSQISALRREGEERAAKKLSEKLGVGYADLTKVPSSVDALKLIPEGEAKEGKLAAIELKNRVAAVAVLDPEMPSAKKTIENLKAQQYEVKVFVVSLSGLEQLWNLYRFVKPVVEGITGRVRIEAGRLEEII